MLVHEDFKHLVRNAPLFSIDLVILNEREKILVGQRKNAPAKGYWFVPGGRVFKNESKDKAIKRISKSEVGYEFCLKQLKLLGIYDHFYHDSFYDSSISTHYINATHALRMNSKYLNLPNEQHSCYRWVSLDEFADDSGIHDYSKIFLPELIKWIHYD